MSDSEIPFGNSLDILADGVFLDVLDEETDIRYGGFIETIIITGLPMFLMLYFLTDLNLPTIFLLTFSTGSMMGTIILLLTYFKQEITFFSKLVLKRTYTINPEGKCVLFRKEDETIDLGGMGEASKIYIRFNRYEETWEIEAFDITELENVTEENGTFPMNTRQVDKLYPENSKYEELDSVTISQHGAFKIRNQLYRIF